MLKVEIKISAEYKRLVLKALKTEGWKINKRNIAGINSADVIVTNLVRTVIHANLQEVADYYPQTVELEFSEIEDVSKTLQELSKRGFICKL